MKDVILYIGSIYVPDKNADAQRALSVCKSFRDLGYNPVIIGMDPDQNNCVDILDSKRDCLGFTAFTISRPKTLGQWVHHTVSIKEFTKVIDYYGDDRIFAVVAMEHEAIALLKLVSLCQKKGIPLIADAEEWYERSRLSFPMNIAKDFDTWLRMRYVYPKKIKNMICISRFFWEHYKKNIHNRVFVPGTIDRFDSKWQDLGEYKPNEVFTIGYAGSLGEGFHKERLDWLVLAVQELNEEGYSCRLHIAGVEKAFLEKAMRVPISEKCIVCLGRIPHFECLRFIAQSDCTAIIREDKRVTRAGFPTKLSESFGCGTPVIATKTSNIADFIKDEENGFLCEGYTKESVKQTVKRAVQTNKVDLVKMHKNLQQNIPLLYQNYTEKLKFFLDNLVV